MISRKNHEQNNNFLPELWHQKTVEILNVTYKEKCEAINRSFEVYGLTYPDELVVAISLVDKDNEAVIPVSYLASVDLDKKTDFENVIPKLIDSSGVFLDDYFSDTDWNGYISIWTEAKHQNINFFYIITRENIGLTLKANALLAGLETD